MNEPVIRSLVAADYAAVLDLNNNAVPAVNHLDLGDLTWFSGQAEAFVGIYDDDNRLGGFLILLEGPACSYPSENYCWFSNQVDGAFLNVDRVVVEPSAQGRGYGQALYRWARALDATHWPLICAEVNLVPRKDVSLRFHSGFGFTEIGQRHHSNGKQLSMLCLATQTG